MSESNFEKIVRILSNGPMTARQVAECLFPEVPNQGEKFQNLKNKTLGRMNRYYKQGYLLRSIRKRQGGVEYMFTLSATAKERKCPRWDGICCWCPPGITCPENVKCPLEAIA